MAYSPRKKAKRHTPRLKSWPDIESDKPRLQGFAGYKAGMTHVLAIDPRKDTTTSGQETQVAVTVVEVPPIKVIGLRFYVRGYEGLQTLTEIWTGPKNFPKRLDRKLPVPDKKKGSKAKWSKVKKAAVEEVRVIAATQPEKVQGLSKKKPDIMELRVFGGTVEDQVDYAKSILGKDVEFNSFASEGSMVDVAGVTKGKGFQGPVKRWGVWIQSRKDNKGRRKVGADGAWNPHWTPYTVPQAGQMGYHHRVEFNKTIMKYGTDGKEVTPRGSFLHYGSITSNYVLIRGSVPGPSKRMLAFRDPVRKHKEKKGWKVTYISTESKQGR